MSVDHIDLMFRGSPRVIAAALVTAPGEVVLIDPGPTSCLPVLEAGLRDRGLSLRDVRGMDVGLQSPPLSERRRCPTGRVAET